MNTTSSLQHFRKKTVTRHLAPVISISPLRVETKKKAIKKKADKKPAIKQRIIEEEFTAFFTGPVFRPKDHEFF
jgi:hypothetical protein